MSAYGRDRVRRVQALRRSNATVPVPGKRWEPTTSTEAADEAGVNEELTPLIYDSLNESDDSGH